MPSDANGVRDDDAPVTRRSRWREPRFQRRLWLAGAVGIPMLVFVLWWFEPQALLFDDVVDEAFPIGTDPGQVDEADEVDDVDQGDDAARAEAAGDDPSEQAGAAEGESAQAEPAGSGPVELAAGSFVSRNRYTVTGTASTYQLEDGQRILRLEDFESTNGPDLFVYLTVAGAEDDDDALDAAFVDLGALTGNIGDQNYLIPDHVDLDEYTSVAIWCRRFTTSFGVADLAAG